MRIYKASGKGASPRAGSKCCVSPGFRYLNNPQRSHHRHRHTDHRASLQYNLAWFTPLTVIERKQVL